MRNLAAFLEAMNRPLMPYQLEMVRRLEQAKTKGRKLVILKGRTPGRTYHFRQRLEQLVALEDYLAKHGAPWDRQPWQFKGATLADMFGGRIMKRIPRELRRIYAPLS